MTTQIEWKSDLDGGIASAKNENKMVFIDFNGPS